MTDRSLLAVTLMAALAGLLLLVSLRGCFSVLPGRDSVPGDTTRSLHARTP